MHTQIKKFAILVDKSPYKSYVVELHLPSIKKNNNA